MAALVRMFQDNSDEESDGTARAEDIVSKYAMIDSQLRDLKDRQSQRTVVLEETNRASVRAGGVEKYDDFDFERGVELFKTMFQPKGKTFHHHHKDEGKLDASARKRKKGKRVRELEEQVHKQQEEIRHLQTETQGCAPDAATLQEILELKEEIKRLRGRQGT